MPSFINSKTNLRRKSIYFGRIASLVLFLCSTSNCYTYSQAKVTSEEMMIILSLPGEISDSSDLNAKIIIKNISNTRMNVYNELIVGSFDNIFGDNHINMSLIVEHKRNNKFQPYSGSFIDSPPSLDTSAYPKRVALSPKDSLVKYFHIDDRYMLETGNYRIKCKYWNDVEENKFIESAWTYFKVNKPIYVHNYYFH